MSDPTIALVTPIPVPCPGFPDADDAIWREQAIETGQKGLAHYVPARYREATTTHPDVQAWVRALVESAREPNRPTAAIRRGPSLFLAGAVGTGKTWEAYGAIRALAVSGAYCGWMFVSAADLYAALRPRPGIDSEQEFERYAKTGVLVLDDLGAAKSSEWTEEVNYRLINYRYEHEKPTLITSNVPPKQLGEVLGTRVASRLTEMTTQAVLKGPDRRRVR